MMRTGQRLSIFLLTGIAGISALMAHGATDGTTPVAGEKTPVAAKETPVAAEKTPVAAKKTPVATKKKPVAAETVEDLLHGDWYEIEFFVFERSEVMGYTTVETLVINDPRRYPIELTTQHPGAEGFEGHYDIDPLTRACFTFPTIEYSLTPLPERADEFSDALSLAEQPDTVRLDEPLQSPESGPPPIISPRLESDPLLDLMARAAEFEAQLRSRRNRWQDVSNHQLAAAAARVERLGLGRVLHHGRWLQDLPPRETPQPILIQAGESLQPFIEARELEGTVAVTLGRYLHFAADLYFHAPALGAAPVEVFMSGDGSTAHSEFEPGEFESERTGYMQLNESRRMRSEEVHYLDHPKLGVVVRIDPVVVPETLTDAFEAVKTSEDLAD